VSGVADLVGRVLAGRYRLLAPIGAGASGRVYVADDVRLRRRVAVKVLHGGLAEDAGFLRRFRTEAQLAASLHHPHIVAVYDWGEDAGMPFMVLELLTGGSLRALLDAGGRLTPSQAAYVGRQVAQGLQYAHARGLVHRDVKSSNLLFDEHAIVRVADFGLARALAEASWTEPSGTLVGTARYAAPEQATGAPLDGRADLYSLAVVLVEAVTGTVPNVGETAIATLAARTAKGIVVPPELGRLGAVLERAGKPKPEDRYPDAATMVAALSDAARQLPPPQPLNLPGLGDGLDDPEPTRVGVAVPRHAGAHPASDATMTDDAVPVEVFDFERAGRGRVPRASVPGTSRSVPYVAIGAIVAALIIGIAVLAGAGGFGGGAGASLEVPSLVGRVQKDAAARATDAGVLMKVVERTADDPAGIVISQAPGPGSFVHDGDQVTVVVSRGPPLVALPSVKGLPATEAQLELQQKGFLVATANVHDETIPAGSVVNTDPADLKKAPRESTIHLAVSDGPAPVAVPDVSGKSCADATAALTAVRFKATCDQAFSETVPVGFAIATDPPAGSAQPRDSAVVVHISKGPERIPVPNVVGMPVEAATNRLAAAGFQVAAQNYSPGGKVKAQAPAAGNQAKRGDTVTLYL
jgi:serine/threonine-protein kinase